MASGCIMGKCPVCGEFIWEDEDIGFIEYNGIEDMVHKECVELGCLDKRKLVCMLLEIQEECKHTIEFKEKVLKALRDENNQLKDRIRYLTTPQIVREEVNHESDH